ncbi:MAG: PSD1 and planctomycete cytochrome C domain-containing protein [Pirellulales bacterium]
MPRRLTHLLRGLPAAWLAAALVWAVAAPARADEPPGRPSPEAEAERAEQIAWFERNIRPLLIANCHKCHGPDEQKGGLRLDSRAAVLAGGDSGPAVVPGRPDEGYLFGAVSYGDVYQMPPTGKLPDEAIELVRRWIEIGAPWPDEGDQPDNEITAGGFDLAERARHWSFQPLVHHAPPQADGDDGGWVTSPVDRFILARLEQAGLAPARPADKRTLLRRVTYDLTGLPPTPAELDAFLADASDEAFSRAVDRLLASPAYAERWARHWLDLVRYAETAGHEFDFDLPDAYRYRDYVIRAFHEDLPYDQFVIEHVAGDLLEQPRRHATERFNESIIATGFFFLGESKHAPVDVREDEAARIDNQIDVFSKTFLGLGVSCARCHDHKFDAISTKDYYALAGYLQSSRPQQAFIDDPALIIQAVEQLQALDDRNADVLAKAVSRRLSRGIEAAGELLSASLSSPHPGAPGREATASSLSAASETGSPAAPNSGRAILDEAASRPAHLLHPWAVLSRLADASPQQFSQAREDLVARLRGLRAAGDQLPAGAIVFADFDQASYEDWVVTGQAFAARRTAILSPRLFSRPEGIAIRFIEPGMAHSGRLAGKLEGVLRSPTFTIEKSHVWYRMVGRQARVNLIIDGFQRIMPPIYGGLTIALDGDESAWHAMDVSMWLDHRAYVEVQDLGEGYAALDRVVFADGTPPGDSPNALIVSMLEDTGLTSPDALAGTYVALFGESVRRWTSGEARSQAFAEASQHAAVWNLLLELGQAELDDPAAVAEDDESTRALAAYARERAELEAAIPVSRRALAMADGTGENERVFIRGNHGTLGEEVPRRFLEALGGHEQPPPNGSGRLELARRMVDPNKNPLLPRVIVNRLWKHHFGLGLVATPDDFGRMGQEPSHPELLDWLAAELVSNNWSLKKLHRLMLLSSTYQMSSMPEAGSIGADPANRLLHSMRVRRLEAEAVRDAMLAVSGRLDRSLYGPSVAPHLTPFMSGRGRPDESGPIDGAGRRSIYINLRRNFLPPMFLAFDFPQPFTTIGRRSTSNVPAQALCLLNNPFVVEQAAAWAQRVIAESADPADRISRMYQQAFGRLPDEAEIDLTRSFVDEQSRRYGDDGAGQKAWSDLAHVLFNAKEFIFIE